MSSLWMPLPFPRCPKCGQSWVRCYHKDCYTGGEVVVEPYSREAKCDGCGRQWAVMNTNFYCSCGYVFHSRDVENALTTAELLRQALLQQIRDMDEATLRIRRRSKESFTQWLYDITYDLGSVAGAVVGTIKRWLDELF